MLSDLIFSMPSGLLAQAAGGRGWVDLLVELEAKQIVLFSIFGSMFVTAVAYAIATIVRAANSSPDDAEELNEKIAALEARVRSLEQKERETAAY